MICLCERSIQSVLAAMSSDGLEELYQAATQLKVQNITAFIA